ncbi:MAG: respiratory nitrate reductase subunit gamma, partial [Candidatus Sumerlaeota bacterium]|nr:respiratory nitrate reductase subunit gamma [Candidatus Sumerlaeota bacterium]
FFTEPVPLFIQYLSNVDGFFQIGLPILYATDGVIVAGLGFLLLRRLASPQLRYISLPADYFPVFLILAIALSGMAMRYLPAFRVDIVGVKNVAMGWVTLRPAAPMSLGLMFYAHVTLVSALAAYFPFSKLMHMPGVFLSPTRNLANNNRVRRHVNPWDYPVDVHTFAHWQEEFKDKLEQAGLPYDEDAENA